MKIAKWGVNILVSIDQFVNAVAGEDPDETCKNGKIELKEINLNL